VARRSKVQSARRRKRVMMGVKVLRDGERQKEKGSALSVLGLLD
jgi:hypothetical protein